MQDRIVAGEGIPIVPFDLGRPDSLAAAGVALLRRLNRTLRAPSALLIRFSISDGRLTRGRPVAAIDAAGESLDAQTAGWQPPSTWSPLAPLGIWFLPHADSADNCLLFWTELVPGEGAAFVFSVAENPLDGISRTELEARFRHATPLLSCLHRLDAQAARLAELEKQLADAESEERWSDTDLGLHLSGEVIYYENMVTRSPLMAELFQQIDRVKDTKLSTIVSGETGTGKELVARAIHFAGNRADSPFEVVPCGSVANTLLESELFGHRKGAFSGAEHDHVGVFERASGGTVFLDEIADMSVEMQQKILRVLQEEEVRPVGATEPVSVDARIISSSRHEVSELVKSGRFREDLYYRLNVFTLDVPPLRDRREDIPLLIDHFLSTLIEQEGVTRRLADTAMRELLQYSWPGNVQELQNVLTRAFLSTTGKTISKKTVAPLLNREMTSSFVSNDLYQEADRLHLRVPLRQGFNEIIAECEKLVIVHALRANRGNKSRVTQLLGIPRQTLYNKLDKYGIQEDDYLGQE